MKERILLTVSRIMGVPVEQIDDNSSPENIEEWESLKHMSLMLALEEEFGIRFTDVQIMDMVTVGRIVETVSGLVPS
jgi:acyl carrier protein